MFRRLWPFLVVFAILPRVVAVAQQPSDAEQVATEQILDELRHKPDEAATNDTYGPEYGYSNPTVFKSGRITELDLTYLVSGDSQDGVPCLDYAPITDERFQLIGDLAALESLTIHYAKITNDSLRCLAKLTKLRTLKIANNAIDGRGLMHVSHLPSLERLTLDLQALPLDSVFDAVAKISSLQELAINRWSTDPKGAAGYEAGLAHLRAHARLRSLMLPNAIVSEKGLQIVATMPELRSVTLQYRPQAVPDFSPLADLTNLESIRMVVHARVPDESLRPLLRLANLKHVYLRWPRIQDDFALADEPPPVIAELLRRGVKIVGWEGVTDAEFYLDEKVFPKDLRWSPYVEHFNQFCPASINRQACEDGRTEIYAEVAYLPERPAGGQERSIRIENPALRKLDLTVLEEVDTIDLQNLPELESFKVSGPVRRVRLGKAPKLTMLRLEVPQIDGELAESIAKCEALRFVTLLSPNADKKLVGSLSGLKQTEDLEFDCRSFTSDSLQVLSDLKGLTSIDFYHLQGDSRDLGFLGALPLLKWLRLEDCQLTGALALDNHPSIWDIELARSKFDTVALSRLPNLYDIEIKECEIGTLSVDNSPDLRGVRMHVWPGDRDPEHVTSTIENLVLKDLPKLFRIELDWTRPDHPKRLELQKLPMLGQLSLRGFPEGKMLKIRKETIDAFDRFPGLFQLDIASDAFTLEQYKKLVHQSYGPGDCKPRPIPQVLLDKAKKANR